MFAQNRDKRKWCDFHSDHGHTTEACLDLKDNIEDLIRRGWLAQYKKKEELTSRKQNTGRDDVGQRGEDGKGGVPQIYVITGGPVYGGTVSGAKASLKEFRHMVNYNDKRYWPNPPRVP